MSCAYDISLSAARLVTVRAAPVSAGLFMGDLTSLCAGEENCVTTFELLDVDRREDRPQLRAGRHGVQTPGNPDILFW